jgi:hypothetical protein
VHHSCKRIVVMCQARYIWSGTMLACFAQPTYCSTEETVPHWLLLLRSVGGAANIQLAEGGPLCQPPRLPSGLELTCNGMSCKPLQLPEIRNCMRSMVANQRALQEVPQPGMIMPDVLQHLEGECRVLVQSWPRCWVSDRTVACWIPSKTSTQPCGQLGICESEA